LKVPTLSWVFLFLGINMRSLDELHGKGDIDSGKSSGS